MTQLPETIDVSHTTIISLNFSLLNYAVVDSANYILALFTWKDRAEAYMNKYTQECRIIHINPGGSNG